MQVAPRREAFVHGRSLQQDNLNATEVCGGFPDERDAISAAMRPRLAGSARRHDEAVGDGADALSDVEVPVRERVKRTGNSAIIVLPARVRRGRGILSRTPVSVLGRGDRRSTRRFHPTRWSSRTRNRAAWGGRA